VSAPKKSSANAAAKNPVKMEFDSDLVHANVYFKIGLARETSAMLKTVRQRLYGKNSKATSALALRRLIQFALAHYDVLEPLAFGDLDYFNAEGFQFMDSYFKELINRQHLKINPKKRAHK